MYQLDSQAQGGPHAAAIEIDDFLGLLRDSKPLDYDIMPEIKDKEASALKAVLVVAADGRFTG